MGALAGRIGRHRARLAGAAAVALAAGALAAPAEAARKKLEWRAGGGIAGISLSLTVYADHTAQAETRGETSDFTLTAREWRKLTDRLRAARFRSLEETYAPEPIVPDSTYETVRHRGRAVTVWTDGAPPRRLTRLLGYIARLHERHDPPR
jgi:hypothetical protein